MAGIPVQVPEAEELSGIGAAYAAGIGLGIYEKEELFVKIKRTAFTPRMENGLVDKKYIGWKNAVDMVLKNKVYSLSRQGVLRLGGHPLLLFKA